MLLVGGCVERGDFGRVKTSAWNDLVATTGAVSAVVRGEPVSGFGLTDAEAELRNRAWRFLVPAGDRPWFDRVLAELVATRILSPAASAPDPRAYGLALVAGEGRSALSLYRRLGNDAAADAGLVAPFAATASRVVRADALRLATVSHVTGLSAGEVRDAEARVVENRCLVAWVAAAARFRVESYRSALERLVVTVPDDEAVPAERAVARLAASRGPLEALAAGLPGPPCLGEAPPLHPHFVAPLVAKG